MQSNHLRADIYKPNFTGSTIDQHGYDRLIYVLDQHNIGQNFYQSSVRTTDGQLSPESWRGYNLSYSYEPTYDFNGQNNCYQSAENTSHHVPDYSNGFNQSQYVLNYQS
jgi:hypothetical protein